MAQTPDRPLITELPVSVRYAGMAGASTALLGSAAGVFRNPAGLATIKHVLVEGAASRYGDNSWEGMSAGAVRIKQFTLGGGIDYLRFSDTAQVRDNLQWAGSAVYRFGIIALGTTLRYVSVEDTAHTVRRSYTGNLGLAFALFDIAALGVAVENAFRGAVTGELLDLPTTTRVGFTLNFVDPQGVPRLLATVEGIYPSSEHGRTVGGIEGGVQLHGLGLLARAGYGAQSTSSGTSSWAVGGSVLLPRVIFDYAYTERQNLGGRVHRLGLRLTL
ncbi:MAG TPA: hypothetical protein VLT17_05810 [Gemmatimonadales bacterium]|nr:hypothetical protein [Gemmatimonadales bacterium]